MNIYPLRPLSTEPTTTLNDTRRRGFGLVDLSANHSGQVRYVSFLYGAEDGTMIVASDDCMSTRIETLTTEQARTRYRDLKSSGMVARESAIWKVTQGRVGCQTHNSSARIMALREYRAEYARLEQSVPGPFTAHHPKLMASIQDHITALQD